MKRLVITVAMFAAVLAFLMPTQAEAQSGTASGTWSPDVIVGLAGESRAQPSNCYNEWQFTSGGRVVVEISACEYTRGGSGFYRVEHLGRETARVCWTLLFRNGREDRSCYASMPPGRVSQGSCFSCNRGGDSGGVRDVVLTTYRTR